MPFSPRLMAAFALGSGETREATASLKRSAEQQERLYQTLENITGMSCTGCCMLVERRCLTAKALPMNSLMDLYTHATFTFREVSHE